MRVLLPVVRRARHGQREDNNECVCGWGHVQDPLRPPFLTMPGKLRCDSLDFGIPSVVRGVITALTSVALVPENWHRLEVVKRYYFSTPDHPLTTSAGWYVICDPGYRPLYVGTATNLNHRLNSEDGSRDGFANPKRLSDPERNFIKALVSSGFLDSLQVLVIPETLLGPFIQAEPPLNKLDRENVEKILNLFRETVLSPVLKNPKES